MTDNKLNDFPGVSNWFGEDITAPLEFTLDVSHFNGGIVAADILQEIIH